MTTSFLTGFSRALISRLIHDDLLEVAPDSEEHVARHVAASLAAGSKPKQLLDTLTRALVSCPEVVELYADDEALVQAIESLHPR